MTTTLRAVSASWDSVPTPEDTSPGELLRPGCHARPSPEVLTTLLSTAPRRLPLYRPCPPSWMKCKPLRKALEAYFRPSAWRPRRRRSTPQKTAAPPGLVHLEPRSVSQGTIEALQGHVRADPRPRAENLQQARFSPCGAHKKSHRRNLMMRVKWLELTTFSEKPLVLEASVL